MFRFEKLEVWQKAVDLARDVYAVTRGFPADERFGLTAQMRRAAVSISSNIAEGSSRGSDTDFARFVEIAYGSLMEVVSQALVARRESFLQEEALRSLYAKAEELARMLSGLRSKLQHSRESRAKSPEPEKPTAHSQGPE
jgi:four helix bundle protein